MRKYIMVKKVPEEEGESGFILRLNLDLVSEYKVTTEINNQKVEGYIKIANQEETWCNNDSLSLETAQTILRMIDDFTQNDEPFLDLTFLEEIAKLEEEGDQNAINYLKEMKIEELLKKKKAS